MTRDPLSIQLADQAARDLAVAEFVWPVALEAGAGTGKTRALVARLATWLLGPGWESAAAEVDLANTGAPIRDRPERLEGPAGAAGAAGAERDDRIAAQVAEGVVAITFTDAAAAEMSRRLGALLGALADERPAVDLSPLPAALDGVDLTARARRLVPVLPRLRLQTIHGFCHQLLASSPFEAGLHPTLRIDADGSELSSTATAVVVDHLRLRHERLLALVHGDVDPSKLHAALIELLNKGARKEDFELERFDAATCKDIVHRLREPLQRFLPELSFLEAAAKRMSTLEKAREALAAIAALAHRIESGDLDEPNGLDDLNGLDGLNGLCELARNSRDDWKDLLERYRDGELKPTESKALGSRSEPFLASARELATPLLALLDLEPVLFELARRALGPLVEEIRVRLQRAGVLSFEDLLDRATELVRKSVPVRRRLRREIRQLLVDEFQDTDRRQCELLAALALGADEGPRPGLFVVGDPKQSIYAFRSADLASYDRFLRRMAAAGGTSARLSVNFRSVPAILAEVERSIAPVMLAEAGVQPQFEALSAGPAKAASAGFERSGRSAVEQWVSWDPAALARGETTKSDPATAVEAAAIAADIRDLHAAEGVEWKSFGILLRARGALEIYLEALRRAGVPYAVQKDRSYYRRREIIDLASAIQAILDPADLLALVAFLRSPLVGVPDAAWIPLWRNGFAAAMVAAGSNDDLRFSDTAESPHASHFAEIDAAIVRAAAEIPPDIPGLAAIPAWDVALREAVRAVSRLRQEFRRVPAEEWVERLRARLLPEPLAGARFLGRFGIANVQRLLSRLEVELAAESDPHRALARLRQAIAEERDAEDARPPEASADAVAVMTIHTAKGLEFPHVYLAQAHRAAGVRRDVTNDLVPALGESAEEGRRECLLFGAPSPGFAAAEAPRRRSREAESVRLLYVALTRAKDRLVVCGNWPATSKAVDPAGAKSFIALLANRSPESLLLLATGQEIVDLAGVPWRLAGRPAGRPAAEEEPPGAADVPEVPEIPEKTGTHKSPSVALPISPATRVASRDRALRRRLTNASALAHAPEDPAAESGGGDDGATLALRPELNGDRLYSLARGVALHRAFELADLSVAGLTAWQQTVLASLVAEFPAATDTHRTALLADLDRLCASRLFARVLELGRHPGSIAARELPLVVAAHTTPSPLSPFPEDPLAGFVGTLDLLYRDPESSQFVVADFKTDEIQGVGDVGDIGDVGDVGDFGDEPAIVEKIARYRPQLELYGRAVMSALALPGTPRLELWFTAVDRIVVVPPQPVDPSGSTL
ncbi:MAG: UvrD-helicase domain-containing protein [Thermoanaerobaculia bacterium]